MIVRLRAVVRPEVDLMQGTTPCMRPDVED